MVAFGQGIPADCDTVISDSLSGHLKFFKMTSLIARQLIAFNDSELGRLFIADIRRLVAHWIWHDDELEKLKQGYRCQRHGGPCYVRHLRHQTPELRLFAIEINYRCLTYMRQPTYGECLLAIRKARIGGIEEVFRRVPVAYLTPELVEIAVTTNPAILLYLGTEPEPGFLQRVISAQPDAFRWMPAEFQTDELCRLVVKKPPDDDQLCRQPNPRTSPASH